MKMNLTRQEELLMILLSPYKNEDLKERSRERTKEEESKSEAWEREQGIKEARVEESKMSTIPLALQYD